MDNKKYLLLGALVVIVGIAGYVVYGQYAKDQMVVAVAKERIERPEISLAFSYPSGEDAFSMVESAATSSTMLQAFVMMPTKEYFDLQESEEARETPPAMSVFVFADSGATTSATSGESLSRVVRLQNWATENTSFTSYVSATTPPEMVEIDGVNAIHYRADGLYQQDIYLASYQSRIYMFVAQFNEPTDLTFTTFQELIASVTFEE